MRFVVAWVAAGCTSESWFDAVEGPGLDERTYLEHAWVEFVADTAPADVVLESSDPAVLAVAPAPVFDEEVEVDFVDGLAQWWDDEGRYHVALQTGSAGRATLSAWVEGERLGEVDLEVAPRAATRLVPPYADQYDALRGVPARQLAGSTYVWKAEPLDAGGEVLAGFPIALFDRLEGDELPVVVPSHGGSAWVVVTAREPGTQLLSDGASAIVGSAAVEVVDPLDVERVELLPSGAPDGRSALVAVGVDATGEPVLGVDGAWSDASGTGDLYTWDDGEPGPEREVVLTWGDHEATAWVEGGPGRVARSDSPGCSTLGRGPSAVIALCALGFLRRRPAP